MNDLHKISRLYVMMRSLFLASLLLSPFRALALNPEMLISQYGMDYWSAKSGLPQNSVHAVVQTNDGFVWMATEEGLARTDGVKTVVFDKMNSALPANGIANLHVSKDGTLWILTWGSLVRFKDSKFESLACGSGKVLVSQYVPITEDSQGAIWFSVQGGLMSFGPANQCKFYDLRNGGSEPLVTSLVGDTTGGVWIGTLQGLMRIYRGKVQASPPAAKGTTTVSSLLLEKDGSLWIGTTGTITHLDPLTGIKTMVRLPSSTAVQTLYRDRDGNLWVGTKGDGVIRISKDKVIDKYDALPSSHVNSFTEDKEGGLWIGMIAGGAVHLRDVAASNFGTLEGLTGDGVRAIYQDHTGRIWVGAQFPGGLSVLHGSRFSAFKQHGITAKTGIIGLYETRDHTLWVGTASQGLIGIRGNKAIHYDTNNCIPDTHVLAIIETRDGSLWAGTRGGLVRIKNNHCTTYTELDGMTSWINTLVEASDGTLLVGTNGGGIMTFDGQKFAPLALSSKEKIPHVFSIIEEPDGTLWVALGNDGIARVRHKEAHRFSVRDGLPTDGAYSIVDDGKGRLWVGANRGIYNVSKSELDELAAGRISKVHSYLYGFHDGMRNPECNQGNPPAWKSRDGRIWFATLGGAVRFSPGDVHTNHIAPSVILESVRADDQEVPLGIERLTPGNGKLDFQYTGPSFVDPAGMLFQYKLDGFDSQWSPPSSSRSAHFTNLQPGHYRFHVVAANSDGVWSQKETTIALTLQPHVYQTVTFKLIVLVGILIAFGFAYMMRVRQLTNRQLELENLIDLRTQELQLEVRERRRAEEAFRFQATHDQLTGISNRRAVLEALGIEIARAERGRTPLALLLVDIDKFKNINDTFGHNCGDIVLRSTAQIIKDSVRPYDAVGRYGGEEFVVVLPGCNAEAAAKMGERLRSAVQRATIQCEERQLNVTLSVGCSASDINVMSASTMIEQADKALYASKANGRNCVTVATADLSTLSEAPVAKALRA